MAISKPIRRVLPVFIRVLPAVLFFTIAAPAVAQYGSKEELQTFDYTPGNNEEIKTQPQNTISIDYDDAELINDPVQGVFMVSKSRWKSWVARSVYLLVTYILLIMILISLPKNEEHNIIVSYVLSGAGATLSLWVLLCAWLLFMLNSRVWMLIFPLSLAMGTLTYVILMKIKRSDISLSELKESFQKMQALSKTDQRLISVEGDPGDWSDTDFLK